MAKRPTTARRKFRGFRSGSFGSKPQGNAWVRTVGWRATEKSVHGTPECYHHTRLRSAKNKKDPLDDPERVQVPHHGVNSEVHPRPDAQAFTGESFTKGRARTAANLHKVDRLDQHPLGPGGCPEAISLQGVSLLPEAS